MSPALASPVPAMTPTCDPMVGGGDYDDQWCLGVVPFLGFFVFPLCLLLVGDFDREDILTGSKIGLKLFFICRILVIASNTMDMELIMNPLDLTKIVISPEFE